MRGPQCWVPLWLPKRRYQGQVFGVVARKNSRMDVQSSWALRVYLENKSIEKSESKCPRVVASRPRGSCASIWFWLALTLWVHMTFNCFLFFGFPLELWAQRQVVAKEVLILLLVLVCRNGLYALAYSFWRSASWWGYHRLLDPWGIFGRPWFKVGYCFFNIYKCREKEIQNSVTRKAIKFQISSISKTKALTWKAV